MSDDPRATAACAFGDPTCPCRDGDVCHYVDDPLSETLAMTPPATTAHRWVEFALRYADGRISPQPNIGLAEAQDFAKRHDLTVVSRVVTATEWEDANG